MLVFLFSQAHTQTQNELLLPYLLHDSVEATTTVNSDIATIIPLQANVCKAVDQYIDENADILETIKKRNTAAFKTIRKILVKGGVPAGLMYLAIVESELKNSATSNAGAAGIWQLMPETARELGLVVNGLVDDRNDFNKSTYAACKVLANYYLYIRKQFGISSWVLTAAAYNNGIGNIQNAIKKQGTNYFQMQLNEETAAYVYKIIAVKELFEYPELYMHDFGYNIFTKKVKTDSKNQNTNNVSEKLQLGGMTIKVDESDGVHPVNLDKKLNPLKKADPSKIKFVSAQVTGKYKKFKDGEIVSFILQEELQVFNRYSGKGTVIQGRGWIIDDRVQIDLGYDHNVILLDLKNEKGIALKKLKNKEMVLMKVSTIN